MKNLAIILGIFFLINSRLYGDSNGTLEIDIQLMPGIWIKGGTGTVSIEYTTNLDLTHGWILLEKLQITNSPYFYIDVSATNAAKRFYRATVNQSPVNPDPSKWVWIAPGAFTMGSPFTELNRASDEGPLTKVTISQGFWMDKYEVTQKEYQAVMGSNPSYWKGENLPVETVTWHDATNYCGKLTEQERAAGRLPAGYIYRLPTEAEWEYACRAGTATRFSFGDDLDYASLGNYAWHDSNSDSQTHPAGQKLPNPWGLYDMHGNVYEWCMDWWSSSLPGGSVTDPKGPVSDSYRAKRGGSWGSIGSYCRSAERGGNTPDYGGNNMGFRPVLAPGL